MRKVRKMFDLLESHQAGTNFVYFKAVSSSYPVHRDYCYDDAVACCRENGNRSLNIPSLYFLNVPPSTEKFLVIFPPPYLFLFF